MSPFFPYSVVIETSSCIRYVFEMAAVWAASSLYQHTNIGDRIFFRVPCGKGDGCYFSKRTANNTLMPPTVDRCTTDSQSQHIGRGVGRAPTDIATDSVDRRSINSINTSTEYRPILGRHIGRLPVDTSVERSTHTWSTEAFITHDPNI